jgi:hypothetical protein
LERRQAASLHAWEQRQAGAAREAIQAAETAVTAIRARLLPVVLGVAAAVVLAAVALVLALR